LEGGGREEKEYCGATPLISSVGSNYTKYYYIHYGYHFNIYFHTAKSYVNID
jgi:hypothetical protein